MRSISSRCEQEVVRGEFVAEDDEYGRLRAVVVGAPGRGGVAQVRRELVAIVEVRTAWHSHSTKHGLQRPRDSSPSPC